MGCDAWGWKSKNRAEEGEPGVEGAANQQVA